MRKTSRHRMPARFLTAGLLVCLAPPIGFGSLARAALPRPPETQVRIVADTLHGVVIEDPYRWLEDQSSPETREWIRRQNEYTHSVLDSLPGRGAVRKAIEDLMRIEKIGMPVLRNGHCFFTRRPAEKDLDIIYARDGLDGEDRILVDPHSLTPDHSISVEIMAVSDDGGLLAYGLRKGGEDETALRIIQTGTGRLLADSLPKARYWDLKLTPDGDGFYYGISREEGDRIYYHAFGTPVAGDKMVFGEGYGPQMGIGIDLSEDGRYLLFSVHHGSAASKTELYLEDLTDGRMRTIVNDLDAYFMAAMGGGRVFMQTDWEAPNGRILAVDPSNPEREHWMEIVPESEATIRGFTAAGGKVLVSYLRDVAPTVSMFEPDGEMVTEIEPPTIGWMSSLRGRWQDRDAFYSFSSYNIPETIYMYDLETLSQTVWAQEQAPIESDDFQMKQVWYESRDGTVVPMFVTYRKGLRLDGSNPVLLTGYGGFRSSMLPYFSSFAALWLKMGGVYAVANLRGGGEFGEEWHKAGMTARKQNTFDDFIGAAEWLIGNGYTNPARLAIRGGSNGGLLVGAALTQRPDLFAAVVCTYPLLDMVRFHKFLVAKWWVPEYGSAEDPEQFEYLYKYSPYHNVVPGTQYPATLFVTGDADTRVAPLHARKMTALLQAATASDRPIMIYYDTAAGHSGGRPVGEVVDELLVQVQFLMWQLGIDPAVLENWKGGSENG